VATADNGREALNEVKAFRPDAVLLDVMMPDIDGFEVCRRMRADGDRTAVIFLTAHDATEDKVRGLTLGGDDYVTKPFSLEEVIARVRVVVRRIGIDPEANSRLAFSDLEMDERYRGPASHRPVADRVRAAAVFPQPGPSGHGADPRPRGSTTSVAAPTWSTHVHPRVVDAVAAADPDRPHVGTPCGRPDGPEGGLMS
jgi:CheY-like chemotaxis protein